MLSSTDFCYVDSDGEWCLWLYSNPPVMGNSC